MYGLSIRFAFVLIFYKLAFDLAFCRSNDRIRDQYSDDGERVLSYIPELSYKMLLLSAVASDSNHPQQCLDKSLPSAKFQLHTVVTRNCDFLNDKCSSYVAVSHAVRAIVIAFRGTKGYDQLLVELLATLLVPEENFLEGKVQTYWKRGFEDLWLCMGPKVKALASENPSYQIWVTGHSLGAAMASLASAWLAYHNIAPRENIILYTFGMPRVGDYKYAMQHDKLVKNSWRVVNYDDIVPHLPPLIEPDITSGPYHHGVEVFYSVVAVSANSTHRECHGTPYDEDPTCSRSQSTVNLWLSIERHRKYFSIRVAQFCEASLNFSDSSEKRFQFRKDRCSIYNFDKDSNVEYATYEPSSSSTKSMPLGSFYIITQFLITFFCYLIPAS